MFGLILSLYKLQASYYDVFYLLCLTKIFFKCTNYSNITRNNVSYNSQTFWACEHIQINICTIIKFK